MAEGEIDNLTMEQYLALTRGNQAPGVVKPEIGGNVNFKIKSQFIRELRKDTLVCNGYPQKDKNKVKTRQNRARDWKEGGKPKPKAYAS
ncbi:hypothetical protein Tco_0787575 [Tanacetum coccineum]